MIYMRLILNVDCRCPEKRCPVHLETEVKYTDTDTVYPVKENDFTGNLLKSSGVNILAMFCNFSLTNCSE